MVLTFLLLGFIVLVILGTLKLTKDITPAPPIQLFVAGTSSPTEQFIFIEQDKINQQLQLPIIHRILTEGKKSKRAASQTKLSSPNVFIFLPNPTSIGQQIILLPVEFNSNNKPVMAKFIGPQSEQYWLRFNNSVETVYFVSESNGSGGYRWTKNANSGPNLVNYSEGGGGLNDDVPGIVEFLKGIPELKGALEGYLNFIEWFTGDLPDTAINNQDIINDMTAVIQTFIANATAKDIQQDINFQQSFIFGQIPTTMTSNQQFQEYTDNGPSGDIHGVLTNGASKRTTTYNLIDDAISLDSGNTWSLETSLATFSDPNNFSNTLNQNTDPSQWWLSYAQFYAYLIYMGQLKASFDITYPAQDTSYTSPWRSDAIGGLRTFSAQNTNAVGGLSSLYTYYYEFLNAFRNNITWAQVPTDGGGDSFCADFSFGPNGGCNGCCAYTNTNPNFYMLVNLNTGSSYIPPRGNNAPSCARGTVPANIIASTDGLGSYACATSPDAGILNQIRDSFTNWLEGQFNNPKEMIDNYAEVLGLKCQSYSSNIIWSCTQIGSSYTENGIAFPYGNFFGLTNGSASASLSEAGVHLLCASYTSVSLDSSTFYDKFLFKINDFIDFSTTSFNYWNPSFTTNGGCCPPETEYIRTCWEGSVSESVGSQTNPVKGRRKWWCVTNTVNNNVTTTTDAMMVQVCETPNFTASLSAGLYPFAQTPIDSDNFSCFYMPSRAMQWYYTDFALINPAEGSGMSFWNIAYRFGTWRDTYTAFYPGAAAGFVNPGITPPECTAWPESGTSGSNFFTLIQLAASQSGFPKATYGNAVPQLSAYAFPTTGIQTPWVIPNLETSSAIVTDGTNTVTLKSQPAINQVLSMPQPSYEILFDNEKLWGLPCVSATSEVNPWVTGVSIVFWDQFKNILPPGTTVSATSTVTAIVLENQFIVNSGNGRANPPVNAPQPIADPCPIASEFANFNWYGYSDLSIYNQSSPGFAAPTSWTLIFNYS
jgi:hypothetical protein